MKRFALFLILCSLFLINISASVYRVGNPDTAFQYGFGNKENIDVALHLYDPSLVGAKVVGVRFPVVAGLSITDDGYKAWLSTELTVKSNANQPDGPTVKAAVTGNYAEAYFDEPYMIDNCGLYVGYSFAMSTIESDNDRKPIILLASENGMGNNLWLRTSRANRTWSDYGELTNANAAIEVILDDSSLPKNAADAIVPEKPMRLHADKAKALPITIVNHGTEDISDITYTLRIGEQSVDGSYHFDNPLTGKYFASTGNIEIPMPQTEVWNTYDCTLEILTVNGQPNDDKSVWRTFALRILPFVPVHRPMFEEYTGLWCGYCPSGYVGMKLLNEHHGEDCVIVSIHNNDAMEVMKVDEYPHKIDGYPSMYVDRKAETDPLFGDNLNNLYGLDLVWRKHYNNESDCDIQVLAYHQTWMSHLYISANVRFLEDVEGADYSLCFYLTADDLYNSQWVQNNYYAGDRTMPDEMSEFVQGDMHVSGLHYDDVLVGFATASEGVIPSSIKAGKVYCAGHNFELNNIKLIKSDTPLRAIAYVVDNATGEVLNANHVVPEKVYDSVARPDADIVNTTYYDLQGRRLPSPTSGPQIQVNEYTDGTRRSIRIIR